MTTWKLVARAPRADVEAALATYESRDERDPAIALAASEVAATPVDWLLEAWLPRRPTSRDCRIIAELFPGPPPQIDLEELPQVDWVAASQAGVEPVRAGPFRIRTPDHPPAPEPGLIEFAIPAAQAFGTGQHATTAGCLEMLGQMKRRGLNLSAIADIGAGTGLLALAALVLWPRARVSASDSDPICLSAMRDNAAANHIALGLGPGRLAVAVAAGMKHELHARRAPYDLIVANILAGPLIELAGDFAAHTAPRGHLLLSGLLDTQARAVRAAYRRAGYLQRARLTRGEWSILWLRKRPRG